MWRWLRALTFRAEPGPPLLCPVVVPSGDPYREAPAIRLQERTVEPCTLAQVLAALRNAGLAVHRYRRGFDVSGCARSRVMPVRVRDIERVTPTEMACGNDAPELLLDLALAIVPLFGPVVADVRFAGPILVDGARDRVALGHEAADRIQRVVRRLATRVPVSVPILIDLAQRMRHPAP